MSLKSQEVVIKDTRSAEVLKQIALILQELRFGSVEIIVHEGRVVCVERREKIRFDSK